MQAIAGPRKHVHLVNGEEKTETIINNQFVEKSRKNIKKNPSFGDLIAITEQMLQRKVGANQYKERE